LVRCFSIRLPRRVASVDYKHLATKEVVASECYDSDLGLLKADVYDVKMRGAWIRKHDFWIQKRVCYPLDHNTPNEQHQ